MIKLGISTSSECASMALEVKGKVFQVPFYKTASPVCESLIEHLEQLLKHFKIKISALEAIAVDTGPGSFTGLRVGIATANALGLGLQIPVKGFSSLDLLASRFRRLNPQVKAPFYAVIHAGRGEVYYAKYQPFSKTKFRKIEKDSLEQTALFAEKAKGVPLIQCGLNEVCPMGQPAYPEALEGLSLMDKLPAVKRRYAHPNYVRLPDAEIHYRKKKA